ncbi:MAG: flagellar motor protein MotB [Terracidiphilus sp.]|jgi:chemotaxis protein MotB
MKRKRRPEAPANHDRWLVSYSDFVTLLFAFFVVLFATTYRDNQAIRKLSRGIHDGFQTMGAFSEGGGNEGTMPYLIPGSPGNPPPELKNQKEGIGSPPSVDPVLLRHQLESALGKELANQEVALKVTPEGFVISLKELGFFDSGQAVLLPGAAGKIKRIANVLAGHGLEIRVEGHSDDQPIHNAEFNSNWELSTARAMAVLLYLVNDAGFDPSKISASGYGQYRSVADNSTPEGRRMNRRVDLVVVAKTLQPHAP